MVGGRRARTCTTAPPPPPPLRRRCRSPPPTASCAVVTVTTNLPPPFLFSLLFWDSRRAPRLPHDFRLFPGSSDGGCAVKDGVDGMIKYVANEPSVGLYFVQQHARASMPLLLDVKVHRLALLRFLPFAHVELCFGGLGGDLSVRKAYHPRDG